MTSYSLKVTYNEGGQPYEHPLMAKNDAEAVAETTATIFDLGPCGSGMFLRFFRESDGQRGYINPDGQSSTTGKSWV